jgi:nitroreductase
MIVLSGDSLAEFWDVSGAGSWFAGVNEGVLAAPVVVVVGGRIGPYLERYGSPDKAGHGLEVESGWPVPFWLTDAAMAAQNLLLLVEEARLGALFFGLFRNVDAVARRLGAPDDFRPVGAIAIGGRSDSDRPSGSPSRRPRLADGELVHLGTW